MCCAALLLPFTTPLQPHVLLTLCCAALLLPPRRLLVRAQAASGGTAAGQDAGAQCRPPAVNVLGGPLECCCTAPRTGFYRDGFCHTGPQDHGVHVVCAQVGAWGWVHGAGCCGVHGGGGTMGACGVRAGVLGSPPTPLHRRGVCVRVGVRACGWVDACDTRTDVLV